MGLNALAVTAPGAVRRISTAVAGGAEMRLVAEAIHSAIGVLRTDQPVAVAGETASSSLVHAFIGLLVSLETTVFAIVCAKLGIDPTPH